MTKLCQVKIHKLLLIPVIIVALVVVFQVINFPYRNNILVVSKESNFSRAIELSSSPAVNEGVGSTRIVPNLDEDTMYKSEAIHLDTSDDEAMPHLSRAGEIMMKSERRDKSSTMRHVRNADNSSTNGNEMSLNTDNILKSDFTFPQDDDHHNSSPLSAEWDLSNHSLGTQHKSLKSVTLRNKAMVALHTSGRNHLNKAIPIENMTASWLQLSSAATSSNVRITINFLCYFKTDILKDL